VKNRGYGFLVPIGRMLTQHEEKNDVRAECSSRVSITIAHCWGLAI
jgi:hypothetical protein